MNDVNEGEVAGLWRPFDDVTAAMNRLAGVLDTEDELAVVMRGLCHQVVDAVPGADMAGLMELRDGSITTLACTDEVVIDVDRAQSRTLEGPCVTAIEKQDVVRVQIEEAGQLWPEFVAAAMRVGVASYLAAPLATNSDYAGAVNLYSHDRNGFAELDAAILDLFTAAADGALRSFYRYLQAKEIAMQLQEALRSRSVIDQVKGVLMAVHGVDEEGAFAMLVAQSQRENVKLRRVAQRTVTAVLRTEAGKS